ncbi:UTRA domain-containing protein [Kitasatospora sp. NPDC059673]|uniref:UTRA domain-containing protein n=1 Tax=Kitasatospora sp. NPDC059673 TaxID=3346901 RepID=UPI0036C24902
MAGTDLRLPRGTPVLRILRTAAAPDGTVVEVNDTRMSADAYEIGYPVTRHPTAAHQGEGGVATGR